MMTAGMASVVRSVGSVVAGIVDPPRAISAGASGVLSHVDYGRDQGVALGVGHQVGTTQLGEIIVGTDIQTGLPVNRIDKLTEVFTQFGQTTGTFAAGLKLLTPKPRVMGSVGAASQLDETFAVNRYYNAGDTALKHGQTARGGISRAPTNGQYALDNSLPISRNSPRRIGIDPGNNEIVIFDRTGNVVQGGQVAGGGFHGHVRGWSDLSNTQQNSLKSVGIKVSKQGNITLPPNVRLNNWSR